MFNVIITSRAEKELRQLDRQIKNRVTKAALNLADDPRPAGCLKVKSEEKLWRVRVGDYRIGYEVDDAKREVTIIKVGHRNEFYD